MEDWEVVSEIFGFLSPTWGTDLIWLILLMEEVLRQLIDSLFCYWQGFIYIYMYISQVVQDFLHKPMFHLCWNHQPV